MDPICRLCPLAAGLPRSGLDVKTGWTSIALFLQECPHGLPVHLEEQFAIPLIQVCRAAPQVEVNTWLVPVQHLEKETGSIVKELLHFKIY